MLDKSFALFSLLTLSASSVYFALSYNSEKTATPGPFVVQFQQGAAEGAQGTSPGVFNYSLSAAFRENFSPSQSFSPQGWNNSYKGYEGLPATATPSSSARVEPPAAFDTYKNEKLSTMISARFSLSTDRAGQGSPTLNTPGGYREKGSSEDKAAAEAAAAAAKARAEAAEKAGIKTKGRAAAEAAAAAARERAEAAEKAGVKAKGRAAAEAAAAEAKARAEAAEEADVKAKGRAVANAAAEAAKARLEAAEAERIRKRAEKYNARKLIEVEVNDHIVEEVQHLRQEIDEARGANILELMEQIIDPEPKPEEKKKKEKETNKRNRIRFSEEDVVNTVDQAVKETQAQIGRGKNLFNIAASVLTTAELDEVQLYQYIQNISRLHGDQVTEDELIEVTLESNTLSPSNMVYLIKMQGLKGQEKIEKIAAYIVDKEYDEDQTFEAIEEAFPYSNEKKARLFAAVVEKQLEEESYDFEQTSRLFYDLVKNDPQGLLRTELVKELLDVEDFPDEDQIVFVKSGVVDFLVERNARVAPERIADFFNEIFEAKRDAAEEEEELPTPELCANYIADFVRAGSFKKLIKNNLMQEFYSYLVEGNRFADADEIKSKSLFLKHLYDEKTIPVNIFEAVDSYVKDRNPIPVPTRFSAFHLPHGSEEGYNFLYALGTGQPATFEDVMAYRPPVDDSDDED